MTIQKQPRGTARNNIRLVTTDGEKFFNSQLDADLYTNPTPEATTAQLEDKTDTINTSADKVLGRMIYNTTTGVTVFASGALDGDTWDYYDSTTAHTPV